MVAACGSFVKRTLRPGFRQARHPPGWLPASRPPIRVYAQPSPNSPPLFLLLKRKPGELPVPSPPWPSRISRLGGPPHPSWLPAPRRLPCPSSLPPGVTSHAPVSWHASWLRAATMCPSRFHSKNVPLGEAPEIGPSRMNASFPQDNLGSPRGNLRLREGGGPARGHPAAQWGDPSFNASRQTQLRGFATYLF